MRQRLHFARGVLPALLLLLLCGSQARALDPRAALSHFSRRAWLTEQGLPQNTVHAVVQAPDGYIWVATEEGLARFDGISFKVFDRQNTPQLKSNDIRSLFHSGKGDMWISTPAGLLWTITLGSPKLFQGRWEHL